MQQEHTTFQATLSALRLRASIHLLALEIGWVRLRLLFGGYRHASR